MPPVKFFESLDLDQICSFIYIEKENANRTHDSNLSQ
jgi:hypothetical protein